MRLDRTRTVMVLGLLALGLTAPRAASAVCVLTCPADVRLNTPSAEEAVQFNYTVTGNADCSGIVQQSGLPSGSLFPVGTTTNCFKDSESAANCCFQVAVIVVGRPGAPALGPLGLSGLAAILAGLGIWAARRRHRPAA